MPIHFFHESSVPLHTTRDGVLGWARVMIQYALTSPGVTPPTMTTGDLEEVIYDLFPRKVITERGMGCKFSSETLTEKENKAILPKASRRVVRLRRMTSLE